MLSKKRFTTFKEVMNAPGFFFVWIFLFSTLGLAIAGAILLWVYAGFSPRNTPIIEYKGAIEIGINELNNFSQNKEIHKYRFSGVEGQIIDIDSVLESDIRFGTKVYIDNPEQMFEVISSTNTAEGNRSVDQMKEIIGEVDSKIFFANKRILLKQTATFTLAIDYDFERHSNYYDFDFFFMIWDRERQEWSNKYPKYGIVIKPVNF
ncbi:MAG: hypothetical protein CL762_03280 [Chloroflexi bacterium]|nr:hypothetical protein [Chloroflexota bacterium]